MSFGVGVHVFGWFGWIVNGLCCRDTVYLGGLDGSSVACLGISVMRPHVMSNFWIIGKILVCSQCLLGMSLRLFSD